MEETKSYVQGEPVEVHGHHHVLPLSLYFKVFGALMVLTVLTILVSFADLGPASLPVAMFVALIKAGLVVGFFMHLRYDDRFHSFVFFSTIIFVVIFFVLTLVDITTRDSLNAEWGNKPYIEEKVQSTPKYKESREQFFKIPSAH